MVNETLTRTKQGWNLGRSAWEQRRTYDSNVTRDCASFRADQAPLNLAFRKYYGTDLMLREELRYCGRGGPDQATRQLDVFLEAITAAVLGILGRPDCCLFANCHQRRPAGTAVVVATA